MEPIPMKQPVDYVERVIDEVIRPVLKQELPAIMERAYATAQDQTVPMKFKTSWDKKEEEYRFTIKTGANLNNTPVIWAIKLSKPDENKPVQLTFLNLIEGNVE